MAKFSTALRTAMLGTSGFKALMDYGELRIFKTSSPSEIPATPEDEETGELLMVLTVDGDGVTKLTFGTPSDGVISKNPSETWSTEEVLASGVCSYFRYVLDGDGGWQDDNALRIQGTCGFAGTDMILTNPEVVEGEPWTLNYFSVALPSA